MNQTIAERTGEDVTEQRSGTGGAAGRQGASSGKGQKAELYRMVMEKHICPFGLKTRDRLLREGYELEDHPLRTREETDAFMEKHGVETTPQTFIGGERVGGYDDLREYLGDELPEEDAKSYTPVLAVFAVAFVMAMAVSHVAYGNAFAGRVIEWFVAMSMSILALLKLRDLEAFTNMFLGYDLLAQKSVRYAYAYPFCELLAGVLMIAGAAMWLAIPTALFIGAIGAVSVYKAVYIDKRDLKCACVGGNSNVPLGFVSLTENLAMVGMALWMWAR